MHKCLIRLSFLKKSLFLQKNPCVSAFPVIFYFSAVQTAPEDIILVLPKEEEP